MNDEDLLKAAALAEIDELFRTISIRVERTWTREDLHERR